MIHIAAILHDTDLEELDEWIQWTKHGDATGVSLILINASRTPAFTAFIHGKVAELRDRFDTITVIHATTGQDPTLQAMTVLAPERVAIVLDNETPVPANLIDTMREEAESRVESVWKQLGAAPIAKFNNGLTPSSFCTVATREVIPELRVLLKSLQLFHPETPVYVACDSDVASMAHDHENVVFRTIADPEQLESIKSDRMPKRDKDRWENVRQEGFHRPELIFLKFEAMEWALTEQDDVMLLDTDVVFLRPILIPDQSGIALSPHFDVDWKHEEYGRYNAGVVWTCNRSFVKWWREAFMTDSKFYEQECLNRLPGDFQFREFGHGVNYGFWRFEDIDYPVMGGGLSIAEIAQHLRFNPDGIQYRGTDLQSMHVHLFSSRSDQLILRELLRYLLKCSDCEKHRRLLDVIPA